jgi:hypothetical protein
MMADGLGVFDIDAAPDGVLREIAVFSKVPLKELDIALDLLNTGTSKQTYKRKKLTARLQCTDSKRSRLACPVLPDIFPFFFR